MKYLKLFEQFEYQSVGITFIYNNMILLTHSTNFPDNIWSYPKGHVDAGENQKDATIREINEELSIELPKRFLEGSELLTALRKEKSKGIKHYRYFIHYLTDEEFKIYFNSKYEVDKTNLQLEEVDQAKFFTKEDAEPLVGDLKNILEYDVKL